MSDDPAFDPVPPAPAMRVVLLGASGTIGRSVLRVLLAQEHEVICPLRRALPDTFDHPKLHQQIVPDMTEERLSAVMQGAVAVISCVSSRSGAPNDAWAVDYAVNSAALKAAEACGVDRFILLSAICVQKPTLGFQQAKLAFEAEVQAASLTHVIVRPTAFFKSLSGQIERMRAGKPYLAFGDGHLTACKPISDEDLARFIVGCLSNPACDNRILPVGGPGPALTPEAQGRLLAKAIGVPFRMKRVPVWFLDAIIATLSVTGRLSGRARAKAELARIGRYYATESMLVWNDAAQGFDADATPEFGQDRLEDFYEKLAKGEVTLDRGEHAVF